MILKSHIGRSAAVLLISAFVVALVAATPAETKKKKENQPQPSSDAGRFTPADGGKTVHDNVLHVTWLLDANVGASECKNVPNVGSGGGMDWNTAWACIKHLNSGQGLLGHTNWQMPATPQTDSSCTTTGTHGNSYGEDCRRSAYGSLFYSAWQRHFGETVAQQVGPVKGGFSNLQPTMYWFGNTLRPSGKNKNPYSGYNSFSFSNGWQDTNNDYHVMYVLPVMQGQATADCKKKNVQLVADPSAQLTWLADANFAALPATRQQLGVAGITPAGTMSQQTAQKFMAAMKSKGYPCAADWQLSIASATNCTGSGRTGHVGYNCNVSGMGHLYYDVFKLKPGAVVAEPPDIPGVKPFLNVQPSLYWACTAAQKTRSNPQARNRCGPKPTAPGPSGFGFSFDMGSGFTDTTIIAADLYLMVYYPDPPPPSVKCSTPACRCIDAGGTWLKGKCQGPELHRDIP